MEYKIFEGGILKEVLKKLLDEGYFPLNLKEAYDWKKKNKYTNWVITSTIYIKGEIRNATRKELENIEETYKKGCLLVADSNDNNGIDGDNLLYDNGRFVGWKK